MLLGRQGGDVGTGYHGVVAEQQEKLLTRQMLFGRLRAIKNGGGGGGGGGAKKVIAHL